MRTWVIVGALLTCGICAQGATMNEAVAVLRESYRANTANLVLSEVSELQSQVRAEVQVVRGKPKQPPVVANYSQATRRPPFSRERPERDSWDRTRGREWVKEYRDSVRWRASAEGRTPELKERIATAKREALANRAAAGR